MICPLWTNKAVKIILASPPNSLLISVVSCTTKLELSTGGRTCLLIQWLGVCLPMQRRSCMPWASEAHESQLLKPVTPWSPSSLGEATTVRRPSTTAPEQPSLPATRASPRAATRTQCSQKYTFFLKENPKKTQEVEEFG